MDNTLTTKDLEDYEMPSSSSAYKQVGQVKGTSIATLAGYILYKEGLVVLWDSTTVLGIALY